MKYDPDIPLDEILKILARISEPFKEGSREDYALRVAAVALLYVRHIEKLEDYGRFFDESFLPASEVIKPSRSFGTRGEAEQWLASEAATHDIVSINGQAHVVARGPHGLMLVRTYLPHELVDK